MSTSALFDRYAAPFGGSVEGNLESDDGLSWESEIGYALKIALSGVARGHIYRNAFGQTLRLEGGVVFDESANAFADTCGDAHVIGINLGQYIAGGHIARELLLKRSCLPDLGRPPRQSSQSPFSLVPSPVASTIVPQEDTDADPTRLKAVVFLRHMMLMFVMMHESFHVLGGHCAIMKSWHQPMRLQEVGAIRSVAIDVDRRAWHYCFEYIADMLAVKFLTGLIVRDKDLYTSAGLIALERCQRLRLLTIAVGLLFSLWHALEAGLPLQHRLHPTPATRFIMMANSIRSEAVELGENYDEITRLLWSVIGDLVAASLLCPEIGTALQRVADIRETQWPEHQALGKVSDAALEELDRYSYVSMR